MRKLHKGLTAVAIALSVMGSAQAAPVIAAGDSGVYFNNYENLYRTTAACAVAGGCLAADAGDPVGYQKIDPAIAGNVAVGDTFVGILNVQNINSFVSGLDTYNSNPNDRFTGYFAQQVKGISLLGDIATITLGTAATDPFGILQIGEMFRLYANTPSFTTAGATPSIGINAATAGTLWASLGLGTEGYAYTRTDFSVVIGGSPQTKTEAFLALDIITKGAAYSGGDLNKVNDYNEDIVGGAIADAPGLLCSAAEIANASISCTDIVGTSEIEGFTSFPRNSPWEFASNDPFMLNRIPEPGSLALVGLALAGLGSLRRRRIS